MRILCIWLLKFGDWIRWRYSDVPTGKPNLKRADSYIVKCWASFGCLFECIAVLMLTKSPLLAEDARRDALNQNIFIRWAGKSFSEK